MVNGIERFVVKNCQSASGEGANHETTKKARGVGYGNEVDGRPVVLMVVSF